MKIGKFIYSAKRFLKLEKFKESSKTKALKSLLKKLEANKERLEITLDEKLSKKEMQEKKEEHALVMFHINKCSELLEDKLSKN